MPRTAAADELYRKLNQRPEFQFAKWPEARQGVPPGGVYFFYEAGEHRPNGHPRVVRVGTHGAATLNARLRQHFGAAHGGGGHRASIFRSLVGRAFSDCPPSWSLGRDLGARAAGIDRQDLSAFENPHECRVSDHLRSLTLRCIEVNLPTDRAEIEQGAIALLSNFREAFEAPSPTWLGHAYHDRPRVQASGLWNQNYVARPWEPGFLDLIPDLDV